MRVRQSFLAMLLALPFGASLVLPAAAAPGEPAVPIEVMFDRDRIATTIGRVLTVESRITNSGDVPTGGLVAHLNVTSLDPTVYVDLEDWSADVTRAVDTLGPGASTALSWDFQAVNAGAFNVYVVLLPDNGPLVASPPVRIEVAQRRALDAGGALPVVIVVPLLVGALAAATRYRVRRAG